jgi:hypothetical protein
VFQAIKLPYTWEDVISPHINLISYRGKYSKRLLGRLYIFTLLKNKRVSYSAMTIDPIRDLYYPSSCH